MLLEATLLGKRVYLLAYDDKIHKFNPEWVFKYAGHLHGLEKIENIRMVRDKEDIEKIFLPGDQLKQVHNESMNIDWFVAKEATADYSSNLKKIVDEILESQS